MGQNELVLNGVSLPVREFDVESVDEGPLLGCEKGHIRVKAKDAAIESDKLGDLIAALCVDGPFDVGSVDAPEEVCLAFGGHFWNKPQYHRPGDATERRVCAACGATQKKVEKWIDADD